MLNIDSPLYKICKKIRNHKKINNHIKILNKLKQKKKRLIFHYNNNQPQ